MSSDAVSYASYLEALETVQWFTFSRVVIPDPSAVSQEQQAELWRAAMLLGGRTLVGTFTESEVSDPVFFDTWDGRQRPLVTEQRLVVRLGGHIWETTKYVRQEIESVYLDRRSEPPVLRAGSSDRVRETAVDAYSGVTG